MPATSSALSPLSISSLIIFIVVIIVIKTVISLSEKIVNSKERSVQENCSLGYHSPSMSCHYGI